MTQQEILENNSLIAEFMGQEFISKEAFISKYPKDFMKASDCYKCFHNSWDWLMKVVGEIDDLGFVVTIRSCGYTQIDGEKLPFIIEEDGGDSIESTYFACVDFAKWWVEKT